MIIITDVTTITWLPLFTSKRENVTFSPTIRSFGVQGYGGGRSGHAFTMTGKVCGSLW